LTIPNLALFLLPHHLFTLLYRPDGMGRTIEHADMLVHPDALAAPDAAAKCEAIFAFWDLVNAQDIAAVERVQRRLAGAGFPGGADGLPVGGVDPSFPDHVHRPDDGYPAAPAGDQDYRDDRGS